MQQTARIRFDIYTKDEICREPLNHAMPLRYKLSPAQTILHFLHQLILIQTLQTPSKSQCLPYPRCKGWLQIPHRNLPEPPMVATWLKNHNYTMKFSLLLINICRTIMYHEHEKPCKKGTSRNPFHE